MKFFASFREKFGEEIEIEAKSVKEIIEKLGIKDAIVAVDLEVVDENFEIKDAKEVAIMPKFNGG